jgi:PTS system galactitol-specific IIA component
MQSDHIQVLSNTYESVLSELGEHAFAKGWVEEAYIDALLEREESYPTGLEIPNETYAYGIAIPHADPEYVSEQALLLGVPADSVTFHSMDDKDKEIAVHAIILLLIKDTDEYTTFLSNLTDLFQDGEFAEHIRDRDADALMNMIFEKAKAV